MQSRLSTTTRSICRKAEDAGRSFLRDEDDLSTAASASVSGSGSNSEEESESPKGLCKGQPTPMYHSAPPNAGMLMTLMGTLACARRASSPTGSKAQFSAPPGLSPPPSPHTSSTSAPESGPESLPELDYAAPVASVATKAKRSRRRSTAVKAPAGATDKPIAAAPTRDLSCFAAPPGLERCVAPRSFPESPPGFATLPAGFSPPPGLALPPGLSLPAAHYQAQQPAPPAKPAVVAPEPPVAPVAKTFDIRTFRKDLVAILQDLDQSRSAVKAVQRVRALRVPVSAQAAEFSDILTRGVEEPRGMMRRPILAFAVGLAAGQPSAFDRAECAAGVDLFFSEVYPDLCDEVPRLPKIVTSELVPMLRSVFTKEELIPFLPEALLDELQ